MGIEDLSQNLAEDSERILVVASNSAIQQAIGEVLKRRNFSWQALPSKEAAAELASREVYDLVIIEQTDPLPPARDLIENLRGDSRFGSVPLVVIHPDAKSVESTIRQNWGSDVHVLASPVTPAALLVKVTTQLRLRKLKAEQARFSSDVSAQNAQLRDLNNRYKRELREAQSLQRSLLPAALPQKQGFIFSATYIPLEAVGGDFYHLWEIDSEHVGFFIGDVTGHGISAALIAAMTKMALAYAPQHCPSKMLESMNSGMAPLMPEGHFVTAAAAVLNVSSGKLLTSRGGHPEPLLWRNKLQLVETISPRGLPLGVIPEARYELHETILEPGDKYLLVTDGLTEAANLSGQMLGSEGLANLLLGAAKDGNIAKSIEQILTKLDSFTGGRMLKDDITLVGVERQ